MGSRVALVALLCVASVACGPRTPPPVAELTASFGAQREFQVLRSTWEHGRRETRLGLDVPLRRFVRAHEGDPTARIASAMLALIAVQRGDLDRADRLAAPLMSGPPGTTRDMAAVAAGAVLRRRGHPREALAILAPLYGKTIDGFTRDVLSEEAALAAVSSGDLAAALLFLRSWLAEASDDDKPAVLARVAEIIARLPKEPLMAAVQQAQGTEEMKSSLLGLVGARLAAIAIATRDVPLARFLVASAGSLLGGQADDVARIAARGSAARLEPGTLGLLLSHRDDELRRRGLEVARGISLAGGLPGSRARLVTRDDRGDPGRIDEALELLNTDGAAVIVAGLDTRESNAAFDYAARTGVPMILLRPPDRVLDPDGNVFVLGDATLAARTALLRALIAGGHPRVALLVGERSEGDIPPVDTEGGVVAVQPCGAPMDFLRSAGADAWIIDGDATCAREAVAVAGGRLPLALGLDGSVEIGARARATAGLFPVRTTALASDPALAQLLAEGRGAPSWWTGLGHDAGVLGWQAVSKLAAATSATPEVLAARKAQVSSLLSRESGALWTTRASGFAGARTIVREIGVVSEGAAEAARRAAPRAPAR